MLGLELVSEACPAHVLHECSTRLQPRDEAPCSTGVCTPCLLLLSAGQMQPPADVVLAAGESSSPFSKAQPDVEAESGAAEAAQPSPLLAAAAGLRKLSSQNRQQSSNASGGLHICCS